jgi:hypothetical protein
MEATAMGDGQIQSFVLNGKRLSYSRSQVLAAVRNQTPRRIDKYRVAINGVEFPPKQVLELLTGIEPINFTTMDAQRILKKLGFPSQIASQVPAGPSDEDHTLSEQVFEQYLRINGYPFEFEPALAQTNRRPDYRVALGNKQLWFEVKEFNISKDDFSRFGRVNVNGIGGGAYDPYVRIRQKIDDAREKFRGITGDVCCLVLFNQEKPLVDLNWQMVYGAMLGPVAVSIPFNPSRGEFDSSQAKDVFSGKGKCGPGLNTTLSAVLVLEPLLLGERRFTSHYRKMRAEAFDHKPSWDELFEWERAERDKARGTERDPGLIQWRVVVHENPWANKPLDRGLFCGRFDERYGDQDHDGSIRRIFAGEAVTELEALEEKHPRWAAMQNLPPLPSLAKHVKR